MPINDHILLIIAHERQDDLLKDAKKRRLVRLHKLKKGRGIGWDLRWSVGNLLITMGRRLQAQYYLEGKGEQLWSTPDSSGKGIARPCP